MEVTAAQEKIRGVLKEVFGYASFRGDQEDIILKTLEGEDSLVIMPTGGGKSICYQIPAIVSEGITVVVSPLIALMNDQVMAMKGLGVNAAALHSHIDPNEEKLIHHHIKRKELDLLYLSPERINTLDMQTYLKSLDISLIAIDEAHCVSIWGNDFRPDYVELSKLKKSFPEVPILALTATADQTTQEDIVNQLNLEDPGLFLSSFERHNITTYAYPGQQRIEKITDILDEYEGESGIVYCLSRKDTESVSKKLQEFGYDAEYYHAGVDKDERFRIQRDFQNDKLQIICATIAFGMGIDKPNIRFVIHYNMPKNLEAYYQEIGRAGRDGNQSSAHMFYSWGDYLNLKRFVDRSQGNPEFIEVQYAKLNRMWEYASTTDCRTNGILSYFGEYKEKGCGHCDNCLNPPQKIDGTIEVQKALSAIYRTKQTVGTEMLIDILRGSHKAELITKGYDKIKTFGAGRDIPRTVWKHYIIQMINKGLISINFAGGFTLQWTPLSLKVLQENQKVGLARWVPADTKEKVKESKPVISYDNMDGSLLERLKQWRQEQAAEMKVPAYIVFGNQVLEDIAAVKPLTQKDLLSINGIGNVKLERFGDDVIRMVKESN